MMFTVVCVCLFILVRSAVAGPHLGAVRDGWRVTRAGRYATESLYPDHDAFWLGLLPGVPAVLAFLCSGRRQFLPRFWRALRWLLILAQVVLLIWQPVLWLYGEPLSGIGIALVVADIVALLWLVTNPRLRACFTQESD